MNENKDICCYFVTKHSWKGKYKRVFSVGTHGITTYNPTNLENTNEWPYNELASVTPNKSGASNEFSINIKKGKKTENMKFSSDFRSDILTEALRFSHLFCEKPPQPKQIRCIKHHWSDAKKPVTFELTAACIFQRDIDTNKILANYDYKDIEYLTCVSDLPAGFILAHGGFSRLHMFQTSDREALFKAIQDFSINHSGVSIRIKKESIPMETFLNEKFGKFSTDEALTSLAEFTVYKLSERHEEPIRRLLCLTENCIVERDPASYSVCTLKPLNEIFSIVRDEDNPQKFIVEYMMGITRVYTSTDRDSLLASMLDGVRASGNRDIFIKMKSTRRGLRIGTFSWSTDRASQDEVEALHLKFLKEFPPGIMLTDLIKRFNVNIPYSGIINAVTQDGLFSENKEKVIIAACATLRDFDDSNVPPEMVEQQFHALRRLVASKAGFQAFTTLPKFREVIGKKVITTLKREDSATTYAAIEFLNALMQPMHSDYDLKQEQLNKTSLLSSKKFLEGLLDIFSSHVKKGTGALVISSLLDFLTYALCPPYSETTEGDNFDILLEMVASYGRIFYKLFQHPSMAIVKGAGMIMKSIIEEGTAELAAKMQELALSEGALPRHLHIAMFTQSIDTRLLTMRQLSRNLVSLWCAGNELATNMLQRILPAGLLSFLESSEQVPKDKDLMQIRDNLKLAIEQNPEKSRFRANMPQKLLNAQSVKVIEKQMNNVLQHWKQRVNPSKTDQNDRVLVLRRRRQRVKSTENWELFYYKFFLDHALPNLIWNFKTREELREALENEMRAFVQDRDLGQGNVIAWNHIEFEVIYSCLADEIKIGEYFLRILLECGSVSYDNIEIKKPVEFFNDLYHRFLLTSKINMKAMCLQAMTIVYTKCFNEIGPFNDTKYIVNMLERTLDRVERDRLLLFIEALILNRTNVKEILDANGVRIFVDLVTLAHLHIQRAYVPTQTNVIEASPTNASYSDSEKEWYYGNKQGPCSFREIKDLYQNNQIDNKTRLWAQGMDGWRTVDKVPQLKWCLMATGQAILDETQLATLILNIFIKICNYYPSRDADGSIIRPLPRIKRLLSDQTCLPHVIQLLLTFDPIIVEKVAHLLLHILQDNPIMSRVYMTGVFYFIVMYTGSNVIPISKFLELNHNKQAFRITAEDENEPKSTNTLEIIKRSILGNIFPEAMICYLENHGHEKFSQIFLGEFDTPEVIWNSEMRRFMIEKVAGHLADFTPRLLTNTRALYQFCPIPLIKYKQLENELFCDMFYLKHLCDTNRFPDWPINNPVALLKDCLLSWKYELEKKPSTMSREQALEILELKDEVDENKIRKAYFKLAQKYHPDKNPEGRDIFEKVNKAYEYLGNSSHLSNGPNELNIYLILKTQIILYKRFSDLLEPYKYAGYGMLIKTVSTETTDEQLFSKKVHLINVAAELCFQTVRCSALNAEELRRENGFEVLHAAFQRCGSMLNQYSKSDDELSVHVCIHIASCYRVASQFSDCREKFLQVKSLFKDLCRCMNFKQLTNLLVVISETIGEFCKNDSSNEQQLVKMEIFKYGALYHFLYYLFFYDFTLDESEVERNTESNQQEISNNLSRTCLASLLSLLDSNLRIKQSLLSLLTPHLVLCSKTNEPNQFLKLLNSNTRNPNLIWNNITRAELTAFLEHEREYLYKYGQVEDADFGLKFKYESLNNELVIGDIYVRVYNEQPTFQLTDAKKFCTNLLDYIGSQAQYMYSGGIQYDKFVNVEMSLEALRNVLRNNDGTEVQCIGQFKLLFTLLRLVTNVSEMTRVQTLLLEIILQTTTNKDCVNDIANSNVLVNLLLVLYKLPSAQQVILDCIYGLASNQKLIKDFIFAGGLLYVLNIFTTNNLAQIRQKSAELFAKLMSDKLTGPKIKLLLQRFLPPLFMDAMKDSSETAVITFEGTHENPELIWNDEIRKKVTEKIRQMTQSYYEEQSKNLEHRWSLPDELNDSNTATQATLYSGGSQNEVVIGGVFIRLFIANPGWTLRKPKEFLTELFESWAEITIRKQQEGEHLELITQALVHLFQAQPLLLDMLPTMGSLPQVKDSLLAKRDGIIGSGILVLNQVTGNDSCLKALSSYDMMQPLKYAMQKRTDLISTCSEMLSKIFSTISSQIVDEFVSQALRCELIEFLLQLLESPMERIEKPAAVKALIVKALKSMLNSLENSARVETILNNSKIWKDYKDQKHDLFLSSTTISGYLTGSAPAVAGYLTAGSASSNSMNDKLPPPVDHNNDHDFSP